jgi:hypothetical protein
MLGIDMKVEIKTVKIAPNKTLVGSIILFGLISFLWPSILSSSTMLLDEFDRGIPGWTVVTPRATYLDGPIYWQYDIVSQSFFEQSNAYSDGDVAPMLINETQVTLPFTFSARLTAGDDDGFGLVFGYANETNYYRVTFARQVRSGYPWRGWCVDRKVNGVTTNLFGAGTVGYTPTFINTANQSFDVTITVNAANQLSLTVVDNVLDIPKSYLLVSNQPLPVIATGRPGMLTWGMSGASPPGFRIGTVTLSPQTLAGNPNALTNWTPVVPPRVDGNTNLVGGHKQAIWSLGVSSGSPGGVLREDSSPMLDDQDEDSVGFTAPTIVTGNPNWTNYTMTARMVLRGYGVCGVLVRYQNPTNFIRVTIRASGLESGPPFGLSIQKVVDGEYSEIFREAIPQFEPTLNLPFDIQVSVFDQDLSILVMDDPLGGKTSHTYGPIDISDPTLDAGMIGLFNWNLSHTDYHFVKVIDDAIVHVESDYGFPIPGPGMYFQSANTLLTLSCGPSVITSNTRAIPSGWSGQGITPVVDNVTNLSFYPSGYSFLQWQWRFQYLISITNLNGGSVSYTMNDWLDKGSLIDVIALPRRGYAFSGWNGGLFSTMSNLSFIVDRPLNLVATFDRDTNSNGLPDVWEIAYFGSTNVDSSADPDRDGRNNLQEFRDGTNPTVPDILRIGNFNLTGNLGLLTITNNTGSRYMLQTSSSITGEWVNAAADLNTNFFRTPTLGTSAFFRVTQPQVPPEVMPFKAGSWSLVILPDTQYYSQYYPELFLDQTKWIIANSNRYNIKYVLHLGDLVNSGIANSYEWSNASNALYLLDGRVPYAFCPGNHEYYGMAYNRNTLLNLYFPATKYQLWPTFGGVMEPNKMENSYHLFSAGGVDWLILALEWGPRNSAVQWAINIAQQHPGRRKILITHAYLYYDNTRYDWAKRGWSQAWNPHSYNTANDPDGTNDGEELWQKLIKVNTNFVFAINGHVVGSGLGYLASTNDFGQVVHQMLVNYQGKSMGGQAFLRLLEFSPDGQTVQVKSYSPYTGTFQTDPENQFSFRLQPPLK